MAEAHPVGFQWVMEAKRRGATIIHVDPRFTRTSAVADIHVPIRAGSDIAFLGGIVDYILTHRREFREYVVAYTNASCLVSDDFADTEDLGGLFSGWDPETRNYDQATWTYKGTEADAYAADRARSGTGVGDEYGDGGPAVSRAPFRDPTLEDPRCVFQLLKRHYQRYTPEVVEEVCGVPRKKFLAVAEALCSNSGRGGTSALCHA